MCWAGGIIAEWEGIKAAVSGADGVFLSMQIYTMYNVSNANVNESNMSNMCQICQMCQMCQMQKMSMCQMFPMQKNVNVSNVSKIVVVSIDGQIGQYAMLRAHHAPEKAEWVRQSQILCAINHQSKYIYIYT